MEFIIGVAVGAGVLAVVIALSMAKAAKQADEIESALRSGGIEDEES